MGSFENVNKPRKKVLIITYYWVPSGGAGVQRWVKFAKYLREFGFEPIIYTPENPEYPSIDKSFEKDIPTDIQIIKTPIWEPYDVYRTIMGKKGEAINAGFISERKKAGWKEKLSIAIRGNFLIPDPRRFWIKPSVQFLKKYISENKIDAIITTGPPHSMHMIGLGVKKHFSSLPWIADFRDPWTNIDFYDELNLSFIADKIHRKMEREVVRNADCVVTVSEGWMKGFVAMQPRKHKVISNGFDHADIQQQSKSLDAKFSISHIGTLNAARNPTALWQALAQLCLESDNFKADLQIQLIGKVDFTVSEAIEKAGLQQQLKKIDYLPHQEAIAHQQSSQLLLLLINRSQNANGILTGKFYEYMASQRPILAIGPTDGDAAEVLNASKAGVMVDFDNVEGLKKVVQNFYLKYKAGKLDVSSGEIMKYSRQSLTGELASLLNELIK